VELIVEDDGRPYITCGGFEFDLSAANTTTEADVAKMEKLLRDVGGLKQPLPGMTLYLHMDDDDDFKKSEKWFGLFHKMLEGLDVKAMQNVRLDFSKQEFFGDSHLMKVAPIIAKMTELKWLRLDLMNCNKITDAGMTEFLSMLASASLLQIKSLRIDVRECSVTAKGAFAELPALSKALVPHL
jgi:hypothetical protein